MPKLMQRFGMDENSLADRRQFIGLGEAEAACLSPLKGWIQDVAADIVEKFYDHQFSFEPTADFFAKIARKKRCSVDQLRDGLEAAQVQYLSAIFEGADDLWDGAYFEKRLQVGLIHDALNLPLKWYLGSYTKFQELLKQAMFEHFEEVEEFLKADMALQKVFNYDMQAVADAFTLSNLESMGMAMEVDRVVPGRDITEYLDELKEDMAALVDQAESIAKDDLKGEVLQRKIPGRLGEAFHTMLDQLLGVSNAMENIAEGRLGEVSCGEGTMGASLKTVDRTLAALMKSSEEIIKGTAEGDFSVRYPAQSFMGSYRSLCMGINELLDLSFGMLSFNAQVLKGSSETLRDMSQGLLERSAKISGSSHESAEMIKELNIRVQTANEGMSQMNEAVKEISENAADVSRRADEASEKAQAAGETVSRLQESSERIGDVIKAVRNIAQQTNLLALNATIEAARAGESGKGFAVVAGEVKELSKETREATQDITSMVERIQKDTDMAVKAIAHISELNKNLKDISSSIASAVEEQAIVTRETTGHLVDIADKNQGMVDRMDEIVQGAGETKEAAGQLDEMAADQNRMGVELADVVGASDRDFIQWGEEYMIGLDCIDEQHQVLFGLVNRLFVGVKQMKKEVIGEVLEELVGYTVNHFAFEEKLFKTHRYSFEKEHVDHHAKLVGQVGAFVEEFKSGDSMVDFRLLNFLRNWLKGHILQEDAKYVAELKAAGVR